MQLNVCNIFMRLNHKTVSIKKRSNYLYNIYKRIKWSNVLRGKYV